MNLSRAQFAIFQSCDFYLHSHNNRPYCRHLTAFLFVLTFSPLPHLDLDAFPSRQFSLIVFAQNISERVGKADEDMGTKNLLQANLNIQLCFAFLHFTIFKLVV
jgi:hypothetical protein